MNDIIEEIKKIMLSDSSDFRSHIVNMLIFEEQIQWLQSQAFIIGQLLRDPQVMLFGKQEITDWDDLNNSQRISELFKYFGRVGALEEVREYMHENAEPGKSTMHFNVPELDEPYDGIESEHYEKFKKTQTYKDLVNIFLSYI